MKRVIIFCTNGLGELVFHSLDDENVNVIAYSDNDRTKWGKAWGGAHCTSGENNGTGV